MADLQLRVLSDRASDPIDIQHIPGERFPLVLDDPRFLEGVFESRRRNRTETLSGVLGSDLSIIRGYEDYSKGGALAAPFVRHQFQVINGFLLSYDPVRIRSASAKGAKRAVFLEDGWKVLVPEGVRPIGKKAPGVTKGSQLADALKAHKLSWESWLALYQAVSKRKGLSLNAVRAVVAKGPVHAYREIYGIKCKNKEMAFHIACVLNTVLFTTLQLEALARVRFTANDIVCGLRIESLRAAPFPPVSPKLAHLEEEYETAVQKQKIDSLGELADRREALVSAAYGIDEDLVLREASAWERFVRDILFAVEGENAEESSDTVEDVE